MTTDKRMYYSLRKTTLLALPWILACLGIGYYLWLDSSITRLSPEVNAYRLKLNELKEDAKKADQFKKNMMIIQKKRDVTTALDNQKSMIIPAGSVLKSCDDLNIHPDIIRMINTSDHRNGERYFISLRFENDSDQQTEIMTDRIKSLPYTSDVEVIRPGDAVSTDSTRELRITLTSSNDDTP